MTIVLALALAFLAPASPRTAVSGPVASVRLVSADASASPGEDPVTFARDRATLTVRGVIYEVDHSSTLDLPERPGVTPSHLFWWSRSRGTGAPIAVRMTVEGAHVVGATFEAVRR